MKIRWLTVSLGAGAAIKGLPFLALLMYAAAVGPDEFAQVSMLALAGAWLTLLASGGMEFAATFEERRRISHEGPESLVPAWYTVAPLAVLFGLAFIAFAVLVSFPLGPWLVMTASALVLALIQPELLGRARMRRDEGMLVRFVILPFATGMVVRAAALVVWLPQGANPLWLWVCGDIATALVLAVLVLPRLRSLHLPKPTRAVLSQGRMTVQRSLPWMGTTGLQSALANVDKFVLYPIVSAELFGLYSLAYQLANISNVLASEYNKARLSHWVRQGVQGRMGSLARESLHYFAAMVVGGLIALGIAWFYRDSFPDILTVCAAVLVALLPVMLYIPVENRIAVMCGRTMPLLWATAAGLAASLIVLIALVGAFGIYAGVLATFVGYGVTTICLLPLARTYGESPGLSKGPLSV